MKRSLLCLTLLCFLVIYSSKIHARTGEGSAALVTNKEYSPPQEVKRSESPKIRSTTTFKITPDDERGSLLNKNNYNTQSLRVEFISYDYYGSGEEDSKTVYKYNSDGKLIEMNDGNTITKYEYDSKGRKIKDTWRRSGTQGSSESISYDNKGNQKESKYFKLDGTYDFSRVYEREYDSNGNIKLEKKWEKYGNGSADLLQYHVSFEYDESNQQIKKLFMKEDATPYRKEESKYDEAGNLIEQATFENGALDPDSKEVYEYNQFNEVIKSQLFNCNNDGDCNSLQYTNTYTYDKYGHMIHMMYEHSDGDAWGERVEHEYY